MKKICLMFVFYFVWSLCYGEHKRISFLKDENEANFMHLFKKNYIQSFIIYKKLFVNYPEYVSNSNNFYLYVESALKNNEYNFLIKLYEDQLNRGFDTSLFIKKTYINYTSLKEEFCEFQKSNIWKNKIKKKYTKLFKKKYPNIKSDTLIKAFNDLNYLNGIDQGVRIAFHFRSEKILNDTIINLMERISRKELIKRDSLNFKELINIIKTINTIEEKTQLINKAFIIIFHDFKYCMIGQTIDSADYFYLKKTIYEGFLENEISAYNYAKFIDRSFISRGDKQCKNLQKYGAEIYKNSNSDTISYLYTIEDIKNIDLIRSEIGLTTLYEASLEYNFKLPESYIIPEKYLTKQ